MGCGRLRRCRDAQWVRGVGEVLCPCGGVLNLCLPWCFSSRGRRGWHLIVRCPCQTPTTQQPTRAVDRCRRGAVVLAVSKRGRKGIPFMLVTSRQPVNLNRWSALCSTSASDRHFISCATATVNGGRVPHRLMSFGNRTKGVVALILFPPNAVANLENSERPHQSGNESRHGRG